MFSSVMALEFSLVYMRICEYLGNKVKLLFHGMVKLFT